MIYVLNYTEILFIYCKYYCDTSQALPCSASHTEEAFHIESKQILN